MRHPDAFVVLFFDKQVPRTAESVTNHTSLPDPALLQWFKDISFQSFTLDGARERAPKLRERGIGQAGDFELNLAILA
jgi:hypothetical protein